MKKQQLKYEHKDRDQLQWEISLRKSKLSVSKIELPSSSREKLGQTLSSDKASQEDEKYALRTLKKLENTQIFESMLNHIIINARVAELFDNEESQGSDEFDMAKFI